MNYYKNREKLMHHAKEWNAKVKENLSEETNLSVEKTKYYPNNYTFGCFQTPDDQKTPMVILQDMRTVEAIIYSHLYFPKKKIAALNFASYKHPGGMYIKGSSAQEESLCHSSNLYEILCHFKDTFYANNMKSLNHSLYTDNLLYTPDVVFFDTKDKNCDEIDFADTRYRCDIITCAAPNAKAAEKYHNVSKSLIQNKMERRCLQVVKSAIDNHVNVLILGAFGCGVFGNDPQYVSKIFADIIKQYGHYFDAVFFAVPRDPSTRSFWLNIEMQ